MEIAKKHTVMTALSKAMTHTWEPAAGLSGLTHMPMPWTSIGSAAWWLIRQPTIAVLLFCLSIMLPGSVLIRSSCPHPRASKTWADLATLGGAVDRFYLDHDRYPTSDNWRTELADYVQYGDILDDAWGQPFRYAMLPSGKGAVWSAGQDRQSTSRGHDPDDMATWQENPLHVYVQSQEQKERRSLIIQQSIWGLLAIVLLITWWTSRPRRQPRAEKPVAP